MNIFLHIIYINMCMSPYDFGRIAYRCRLKSLNKAFDKILTPFLAGFFSHELSRRLFRLVSFQSNQHFSLVPYFHIGSLVPSNMEEIQIQNHSYLSPTLPLIVSLPQYQYIALILVKRSGFTFTSSQTNKT